MIRAAIIGTMNPLFTELNSIRGLDDGIFGPCVRPYIAQLQQQGYCSKTVRMHLCLFANFSRWLTRKRRSLCDVNEKLIDCFLQNHLCRQTWRAGERPALHRLLNILRKARITPPAKTIPPTPAQRLAADYRRYLSAERGCASCTLENYGRHIDRFVAERFGIGPLKPARILARDVVAFVQREAQQHSRGRILQVVTALRSFLRFMHYRGHIASDLAQAVPTVAHWRTAGLPKHLPPEAVQKVLDSCDQTTAVGRRNYAILLLMARLGLRAGEVIALQLDDIDWENAQLTIRSKKGRGWARLPLPADVGKSVAFYLEHDRPSCSCRTVFIRMFAPYQRLSNSSVISVLTRNSLEKAGVDSARKGAHLFRHSLATMMLRRGASLEEIGQVLRHKDPDTTAIYAKVDLDALRPLAIAWPGGVQ